MKTEIEIGKGYKITEREEGERITVYAERGVEAFNSCDTITIQDADGVLIGDILDVDEARSEIWIQLI